MASPAPGAVSLCDFVVFYDDFLFREQLSGDDQIEIWTAHQKSSGRFCLVKKYAAKDPSFHKEVSALARAGNPFIPKLIGFTDHSPFVIAVEHKDTLSLASDLKQTQLNGTQLTVIALGIAHGMARLEQLGMALPVLSCDTVMMTQRHFPKVCPFGCAGKRPRWKVPEVTRTSASTVYDYGMVLGQFLKMPDVMTPRVQSLIEKCTRQDPARRPSFKRIYEWFLSGSVEFSGCKRAQVEKVCARLNGIRLENASPERIVQERPMEILNVRRESENLGFLEKDVAVRELPEFCAKVEALMDRNPPKDVVYSVAESILKKLGNEEAVKVIAKSRILRMLPFYESRMCETMADGVCVILKICPELASNYSEIVGHILSFDPAKGLVLVQLSGKYSASTLDLLFKYEPLFMKSRVGAEYISLLVRLCDRYPAFRQKRFGHCRKVFCNFMDSFDKNAVKMAYSAVCLFYDDAFDPSIERLESDLADPDLGFYALSLLVRMKDVMIRSDLAGRLVTMAQSNVEAALFLLKMLAKSENWCKMLLEDSGWMVLELPTLEYTLKIFLVVMSYANLRPVISNLANLPEFLTLLARTKDQVMAVAICSICTKLTFSKEAMAGFVRQKFLQLMFAITEYFNNDAITEQVFLVVGHLSTFGYTKDFLLFAPKLKDLLYSDPRTSKVAFETLFKLSSHEPCARLFLNMRLNEDVQELFVSLNERPKVKQFCSNLANFCK